MCEKYEKGRTILGEMNKLLVEIARLLSEIIISSQNGTKLDEILGKLKHLKDLKTKFLDIFGLKDLYKQLEEIDRLITFVAEGAKISEGSLPIEMKKIHKEIMIDFLKKVKEKKELLEKKLREVCGEGRWLKECEFMNKYLDNLISGASIGNEIPERLVNCLHDFKSYIVQALPYEIGHVSFGTWYKKLSEINKKIDELTNIVEAAKNTKDFKSLLKGFDHIDEAMEIKKELEDIIAELN